MKKQLNLLFLFAFAVFACARVEGAGYAMMDNDRILLMNNDNKFLARVTAQGYYDTNTTDKTYWKHSTDDPFVFARALLTGVTHTMYKNDGTRLWHLEQCRAGSGTVISSSRNYIPWTATAVSIKDGSTGIPVTPAGVAGVGSVIMRNSDEACVYSPLYTEGIGTIYFDAVNAFVNFTTAEIALEIATDVTPEAAALGMAFERIVDEYDSLRWRPCPFDVFMVNNSSELMPLENGATNLVLAVTAGGSNQFYRVRAQLNYYSPIRFRIRRLNQSGGNLDMTGLALLDNIIASYPPMTAELHRCGTEFDASLKGSEVLGFQGDFTAPFLSILGKSSKPLVRFSFVTNSASAMEVKILNPQFHYRWRYLNQIVSDWRVIPFDQSEISSSSVVTSNLVGQTDLPLTDGVGDLEYYFTAEIDAPYYLVRDYACNAVGYGSGWTEQITAITNRAAYTVEDYLPSMGTDYFTRIREGESNMEWVQLVGTLTITNEVAGSNEVVRLLTADGTIPRMKLAGDHTWRYHYEVPTNAVGGKLSFKLVTKEYYTNETAATSAAAPAWFIRTNNLFTVEETVTAIPYTTTLGTGNPNEISVALDDASSHLKIEYNDERNTLSLTHASYQSFNLWTDARHGFCGNSMETNGDDVVSNSGVSKDKKRYDAPFNGEWPLSLERNALWHVDFNSQSLNGWTARYAAFVAASRDDDSNLALALDGWGEGSVGLEQYSKQELPFGLDSVTFNARLTQPIEFKNFATYSDGANFKNYAISAGVTMSHQKETPTIKPSDMSPDNPSVSFVGYYRDKQGCYEFRMTRTSETELTLALYKWTTSGSSTKPALLTSKIYTSNLLVPTSDEEVVNDRRTAAYFLVYTLSDGCVKLEGHISSERTSRAGVSGVEAGLSASAIAFVDRSPGVLARGGSYGVGSADCRAGFGTIKIHEVVTPPTEATTTAGDAVIGLPGMFEGREKLEEEWGYTSRWEVTPWDYNGGLSAVVPSNQRIEIWLSDASGSDNKWFPSGYEAVVNSFSTNKYVISPHISGSWNVMLKTGEDDPAGVVVDDVEITPWEGTERWGRDGSASDYVEDWVYTKGWITEAAENARVCTFQPSRGKDGYPMGLRSPYIDEGLSHFSYSYENVDSNCVLLVQIATNMSPSIGSQDIPGLTESVATNGSDPVWTTVERHTFKGLSPNELAGGTRTAFVGLRRHWTYDNNLRREVYTNVCGAIRVIVDPTVVSKVANANRPERDDLADYGKITITKAYCYNEPTLDQRSWFGWNVHTEGWDGMGNAGPFANMMDWPNGLSIALNFSARPEDNMSADALGIGLGETDPTEVANYAQQNPFIQSAALTNGIGTVSFRARLFDTSKASAVITLYGSADPAVDQPRTESQFWKPLTNFVVTTPTYQSFEWTFPEAKSDYHAIRLEVAGARWGRYPSQWWPEWWEWEDLTDPKYGAPVQEPINRVFIDDMSVGESVFALVYDTGITASFGDKQVSVPVEWFAEVEGWTIEQIHARLNDARGILEVPGRAANGRLSLVECYVLGIDPKDPNQDFVITEFPLRPDGMPDLANIKFEPSPEKWNVKNLALKVKGAVNLTGEWWDVASYFYLPFRFFKLEVTLP